MQQTETNENTSTCGRLSEQEKGSQNFETCITEEYNKVERLIIQGVS